MESNECPACKKKRKTPRTKEDTKALKNRINRLIGQLNGITKMIDENRYCMDILIQVTACEGALQEIAYALLKDHMSTCMVTEIKEGNNQVIDEALDLIRKLK